MTGPFQDPYALAWSRAFVFTVVVELAVATPLLRATEPSLGRRLVTVLLANVASHPAVWFVFPALALGADARLWLSEGWAVAVEVATYVLVLRGLSGPRALGVSALANGASLGLGLALRALTGWV